MKKMVLMTVAAMITSLTFAQKLQDKDVPATVKTALQKQYPNAKEVKWEKGNGNYEADFELKEIEYSILLNATGSILETEIEISIDQLPSKTKEYVSKNYPGKKIKEAAKNTNANGTITYEADVDGKDLIFDSNGNFINEELEDEKEEGDDK